MASLRSPAQPLFSAAPVAGESTLYDQVADRIAQLIQQGVLRPAERIPSVRKLHSQLGVSLSTVLQAYLVLENRGLIEARPQSGYYVKTHPLPPEPKTSSPPQSATQVSISERVMSVLQAAGDPKIVPLGAAIPGPELFPTLKLNRVLASMARRHQPNCYDFPSGNKHLRHQVARRSLDWGCGLAQEEIITTCGCTEALNLCLRAVARPGDTIAVESPTYYGILQLIESLGMKALEIPTHPRDGVCLDQLERALKKHAVKACMFALNFNNPLGSCMPDDHKKQLVELLTRHEIPLIEDDLDGDLYFGSTRPAAAKAFDREGLVLLCSSFTKTLAPGYRVGWTAPGRYRTQVERLKFVTTGETSTLLQVTIAEFLQNGGYDRHLRRIRKAYAQQVQQVTQAICGYFPQGTRVTRPTGGYVLWVELPTPVNALDLYQRALSECISIAPGPIFSASGKYQNFIRLNCGHPWSPALEQGMITLGRLVTGRTGGL
ncbi:aminotransferase-like domain-containing protein [Anthocerotibacter panamensis]|uniref:aminotransferase-like domain-containing protein n=1 Tax=Anthocerotibacter panamensis TaxID=2857077 RepID=UPI001FDA1958|nr:PLP-dependent aminotransferase family protein [Anthocerotibacter panamensis]